MNPQMLVQMILNKNPTLKNSPIVNNAFNMASNGNTQGLNIMLNNLCQERGIDINKAVDDVKRQLGMN